MSVFVMADLHLATVNSQKSMEVFGRRWINYIEKISKNWKTLVKAHDTVIVPGDISWGLTIDEAKNDLKWLDSLPGKKILIKGNHDFWWSTASKINSFFEDNNINSIKILNNSAVIVEDYIIAGSRGWFTDRSMQNADEKVDYDKIVNREAIRLDLSLKYANELKRETNREIVVFLHFPPVWGGYICEPIFNVLKKHKIYRCYFGHIHGNYSQPDMFEYDSVKFYMISADYLDFIPRIV